MAIAAPVAKLRQLAQTLPLGEGEGSQGGPPLDANAAQPNTSPPTPPANASPSPTQDKPTTPEDFGFTPTQPTTTDQPKTDSKKATTPEDFGFIPVKPAEPPKKDDQPKKEEVKPEDFGFVPVKPDQPTGQVSPGPTGTADQPWGPQPKPPTPMPSGTGVSAPQGSTTDPEDQKAALVAQGLSPGAAQAILAGQTPKTISGDKPAPPKPAKPEPSPTPQEPQDKTATAGDDEPDDATPPSTTTAPAAPTGPAPQTTKEIAPPLIHGKPPIGSPQAAQEPQPQTGQKQAPVTEEQAYQSLSDQDKALYNSGKSKLENAPAGSSPNLTSAEQAVLDKTKTQVAGSGAASSTDEPKTIVGGGMLKGTATSFGLNYDGSYDKDDNGIGFFGGVNTRNPKLKAVAVPVDVLEAAFGKFTQKQADGTYAPLQTPEAKKIIAAIRSAHVEALGLDGKIHNFPIVDIQGSLGGHPGKVLDMTPAAGRELGFSDNHAVSYQIAGGDGKPYAIPADQLAGWNSGEGDKKGSSKSDSDSGLPQATGLAGQPMMQIPGGSGGGPPRSVEGGPSGRGESSGGGNNMGGSPGGAATYSVSAGAPIAFAPQSENEGARRPQPPPPEDRPDPMIAALMQRGFTQAQAIQYAQGVQNIAPGKGLGPLNVKGPPPAAPSALPGPSGVTLSLSGKQPVTPKLLSAKQLMPSFKVTKAAPAAPGVQAKAPLQLNAPPVAPAAPAQKPQQAQAPPPAKTPVTQVTPAQQAPARQPQQAQAPPPAAPPPKDQPLSEAERPLDTSRQGQLIPAIKSGGKVFQSSSHPLAWEMADRPEYFDHGYVKKSTGEFVQSDVAHIRKESDLEKPFKTRAETGQTWKAQKGPDRPPEPEPTEFTGGRPAGSTHGNPNPPGVDTLTGALKDQGKQHKALLSPDDPRVSKQSDGYIKGEHFVEGDPYHDQLLGGLPYGKGGPQREKLGKGETAIADKTPMHISYISSPKEAEQFPTRESRTTQYEKSSPEARLMKATEGALVGHSMIPLSAGIKLPTPKEEKAGETHQGYLQGISTNVMANNFQHLNDKLEAMGRKTPYPKLGAKFANDLEGYYHNLLAGHTATGRGYAIGTDDHPNTPDRSHVPYQLTRKEADFIGAVVNNTAAFAGHDDAKKIRELARANGTLITEKGETNRLLHDIEQADPGWSGRGTTGHGRVLEPSIKTFKTGLIHEIHPTEQHLPETIRPGKEYQMLTKALARTSERGRPDIAIGASLHHTFQDNRKINQIERDFSDHKIDEATARRWLKDLGEDPEDYRFVSGSGGLITPYEDDPEALTPEEHTQMKDNLRQKWVSGGMNVEDYRKKSAEVPLPSKPSKQLSKPATVAPKPVTTTAGPVEAPEAPPVPKPKAPAPPRPPKPKAPPTPEPEDTAAPEPEKPQTPPVAAPPKKAPAPDEPLPAKPEEKPTETPTHTFKEVKPEEFIQHRNKSAKPEFLSDLKPEDIQKHKLFTNQDNTIGAAVSPEGDIQNVFNNGGEKGGGGHAVAHAIEQHGGRTLDAYDGFLPKYYRQFGFHETGRTKFNPEYAPKWDTAKHGTPDVVHMGWGGHPEGGPAASVTRAKNRDQTKWIPNERSTHYDDDFDAQKARSQAFARGAKTDRPDGAPGKAKAVPTGKAALPGSGAAPGRAVAPPAYGEPLPKVKADKPAGVKPPVASGPVEKPSWKTANEKARQAYLKKRVAYDMERQYKGADAHQIEVDRNDDKSIKYDPSGNPIYKKIDYDLANSPLLKQKGLKQIKNTDKHEDTLGNLIGPDGKEVIDPETGKPVLKHKHLIDVERSRLSAMHAASAVKTMGDKIVDEYMKIKDIPEIAAGEGWYSRMRTKLAAALGEHHELFAQLLGATSAKTPVRNNFIQSLDALEQYKSGKFDNHIKKYLEGYEKMREGEGALVAHMKKLGIPLYDKDGNKVDTHEKDAAAMANWIHHHGILPRQQIQPGQEEGSKYNANSIAVLKALAGTWLKEVGAPKTPNFAGNLTGRTLEATIDVWAARFLKRLGYEGHGDGPWRSQGKSEPGVNSLDFAFSQDAMRHAADEITRRTGKKMNPDDLQAIAWFAEKHHWEKQGWTRGAGAEKSSFDDVADLAFPKTGEAMTSDDLRKHYGAIQAEAKRVKARVKTAKGQATRGDPKLAAYMEKHGLTHEQVHGPEVEEEDEDEAA